MKLTWQCQQNPHNLDHYLGNIGVKKAGVKHPWTQEEVAEYKLCVQDPIYFIEKYVKVVHPDFGLVDFILFPYQKELIKHFQDNRFAILLACRQSGKSITVCAFILWYLMFNKSKLVILLANKGEISKEMLSRILTMLENLPFFLQPGSITLNKGSMHFSNGNKIEAWSTTSSSVRGKSPSLVYMDEFAFVENDLNFYTSTYPSITAGKKSRVIITSTANGVNNVFYTIWQGALQEVNSYIPYRVDWWDVPGRDEAWKEETIRNTSPEQFNQEFSNEFSTTARTLIRGDILLSLKSDTAIRREGNVQIYKEPVTEEVDGMGNIIQGAHSYVMCVDVSKGRQKDYSTFSVIDVSSYPYEQVASFRDNEISPVIFPEILDRVGKFYNEAFIIVEANDIGAVVYNSLHQDYQYPNLYSEVKSRGYTFGLEINKKTKGVGCSNLKDLIEGRKLIPVDKSTILELSAFEAKGDSFSARKGYNDDMVMPLVAFSWYASTEHFNQRFNNTVRQMLRDDIKKTSEVYTPYFGEITSADDSVIFDIETSDGHLQWKEDDVFGKEFGLIEEWTSSKSSRGFSF